ncbi:phage holin family protein [Isoptericola aurantiacus]|uniref:phage holin family protein n=1 Tax=Isoptericola aurantiacus TaxID=3377839 RepID=UPI00383A0B81
MTDWDDGRTPPADRPPSMGRLMEQVSEQATRLARAEIALAKAELAEKAKRSGAGVGLLFGALVIVLYAVGVLIWAAVFGLADIFGPSVAWMWLSAVIIGVAMLLLAGLLVWVAVGQLKKAAAKPETIDRVKDDVATVKEGMKR